jgi:hypothetical protein
MLIVVLPSRPRPGKAPAIKVISQGGFRVQKMPCIIDKARASRQKILSVVTRALCSAGVLSMTTQHTAQTMRGPHFERND